MSTSVREREAGSVGTPARPDTTFAATVVPTQPTPAAGQAVVVAPPWPAARLSLGTRALVTALVVRSCQPGALRTALDGISELPAR